MDDWKPRPGLAGTVVLWVVVVSSTVIAQSQAPSREAEPPHFHPDRLVVKLRPEILATAEALPESGLPVGLRELDTVCDRFEIREGRRLIRSSGVPRRNPELFEKIGLDRLYVLELPVPGASVVQEAVRELSRQPWVEYAEPVYVYELLSTVPNDPLYPQQWPHENSGQTGGTPGADMDTPEAWDVTTGDPSVIIAVMDTGVDEDHPDLVANLLPGVDFTNSPEGMDDLTGHGTGVAGNAAARGNNSEGVAGVCWSCSILPLKTHGSTGFHGFTEAMVHAADSGADAVNMSFGGNGWSEAFEDATDYAVGVGTLPLAAVGNTYNYLAYAPSTFPNVLAVTGSNLDDDWWGSYGEHLDVAAPTVAVSTTLEGGYAEFGGTSGAAPRAAGLALLLRAADPTLHVQELRQLLRLGVDDEVADPAEDTPGWDQYMGFGRINADRSMALIDGPWLALDRPHYVCAGDLSVDLKDPGAGGSVDVTLTASLGGDVETVIVTPVTAFGYYRGTIPLAWAGKDGPVVPGDGKLDVAHGESVTAEAGALSASAFLDSSKQVCLKYVLPFPPDADCDADGILDPGEVWDVDAYFQNYQTEKVLELLTQLAVDNSDVELIEGTETYDVLHPNDWTDPTSFVFRVAAGSPPNGTAHFEFAISGSGWEADVPACTADGRPPDFVLQTNYDLGGPESWLAIPPVDLAGSDAGCPSSFGLSWNAVAGAGSYKIYRSEISCADAEFLSTPYGTRLGPSFNDTDAESPTPLFYAVEAAEIGTGCPSERACIAGGCICLPPADPTGLLLSRLGDDLLLSWNEPGPGATTWNVYRETISDRSVWGPALAEGVTDEDAGTAGIQFTDAGGVSAGSPLFYLVTADNGCAESPLGP